MGGCRCTFRACPNNSSNQPKMHFFHFPIRDRARCEIWAKNSNNMEFLSLNDSQLKNRVICQEHFRENCFMNYLHDRLTKLAIPTILTLDTGEVLDFDATKEDEDEQIELQDKASESSSLLLNKTTKIVKKEFVPQISEEAFIQNTSSPASLDSDAIDLHDTVLLNVEIVPESTLRPLKRIAQKPLQTYSSKTLKKNPPSADSVGNSFSPTERYEPSETSSVIEYIGLEEFEEETQLSNGLVNNSRSVKILNMNAVEPFQLVDPQHESTVIEQNAHKLAEHDTMQKAMTTQASKVRELETVNSNLVRKINAYQSSINALSAANEEQKLEIETKNQQIAGQQHEIEVARQLANESAANKNGEMIDALNAEVELQNTTITKNQHEITELRDVIERQEKEISQQRVQMQSQKTRIVQLEQIQTKALVGSTSVSTSSSSVSKPIEKLAPMSKPHLFNGIRRYLNPSMVALLRMEMFGEAEREYKPDEREIAMELMRLPPTDAAPGSVYDFMRSEWRFRLPPRNDVLQWIQERDANANNIEDEWDDC